MEALGCIAAIFGISIVVAIIRALSNRQQRDGISKETQKELKIRCKKDSLTTDSGQAFEAYRIFISGTCFVPSDNYPCSVIVRAVDVTDESVHGLLPVFSLIQEMADEDGVLAIAQDIDVPYEASSFNDLALGLLIPKAMVFAKKGLRRLQVFVAIAPRSNTTVAFKQGSTFIECYQETYGYMEGVERDVDMDKAMARLAIAVCAADGQIDKRETAVIHRFFEQRLAYRENTAEYKEEISRVLKDGMRDIRGEATDPKEYVRSLCEQIGEFNEPRISQEAYELCAQIVAADQQVVEEERDVLNKIAEALEIPDKLARGINDRYFTMAMFERQSQDAFLDMPPGLTREEQIAFLNREYEKWRSRVTHEDAQIRTEAELRLKHIAKLRLELGNE